MARNRNSAEQLFLGLIRAPLRFLNPGSTGGKHFAGVSTVLSGSATIVVSTTQVKSNSGILLSMQRTSFGSSGQAPALQVSTIIDSTSFVLAWGDNVAKSGDTRVTWQIIGAD